MAYLTRYEPFRETMSLRDAMDRLFQESFVRPAAVGGRNGWVPMDVEETAEAFKMTVALPGWKPEDIHVTVQEGTVTVSGEYKPAATEGANFHVRERAFTSFSRTFSFPMGIAADKAEANYENGELVLTLPKAESAKPRKIQIGAGATAAK